MLPPEMADRKDGMQEKSPHAAWRTLLVRRRRREDKARHLRVGGLRDWRALKAKQQD